MSNNRNLVVTPRSIRDPNDGTSLATDTFNALRPSDVIHTVWQCVIRYGVAQVRYTISIRPRLRWDPQ